MNKPENDMLSARGNCRRFYRRCVITVLLAVVFASGCAEKGPILLNIAYQAPAQEAGMAAPTVLVSPLKDVRGKAASVLGRRSVPSGLVNDLVVQGTVAKMATKALIDALERHGATVREAPAWDLNAEGMQSGEGVIQLGGEIRELWLESASVPFRTNLKASVRIKIVAGDTIEKTIVRTLDVSSKIDQDILYSREQLESTLSEALTGAIDQIFKDEELKKRLL